MNRRAAEYQIVNRCLANGIRLWGTGLRKGASVSRSGEARGLSPLSPASTATRQPAGYAGSASSVRARLGLALCLVIFLRLAAPAEDKGSITLSADFDNGSLGEWKLVAPDTVRFTLTKASAGVWFHFYIRGVKGRTITFVVPMTRSLSRISAHYYDGRNRPAYSYSPGGKWELAQPGRVDKEAKTFTFEVTFREDAAWVAFCVPYTNDTLATLLQEYANDPHLRVQTLATTAEGRPVYRLLIAEDPDELRVEARHTVWVVARESGWSAPTSWAADGLIRFALGSGPTAKAFRRRLIINVVPILTPDAVAGGWMEYPTGGGKQTYLPMCYGKDYPEVVGLRSAVRDWVAEGRRINFALRLNSFGWLSAQHEFRQEQYLPQEQVEFDGLADRLHRLVPEVRWTRGHLFPGLGFVEFCYRNFQVKGATLTLGLGARGNQMTQAKLQDVGQALGEALLGLYSPGPVLLGGPTGAAR